MAIQSFSDKDTENFFYKRAVKKRTKWGSISRVVMRKLDMLHYAANLIDLKVPPGN